MRLTRTTVLVGSYQLLPWLGTPKYVSATPIDLPAPAATPIDIP